jgi:hypothetical protein
MSRIAILDDYQRVARRMADWSRLQSAHDIVVFDRPFASPTEAAAALQGFDVITIMRERTSFGRAMLEHFAMPRLILRPLSPATSPSVAQRLRATRLLSWRSA